MMETDDRDCATCQNPSKGDMDAILEFVNDNRTKFCIVLSPSFLSQENEQREKGDAVAENGEFLEREGATYL